MNTKVIIALVAVTALALAAVGLAAAQIAQNQTVPGADPNTVPAEGFWGWIGNCFGYRAAEPYQGQYVAPPTADNVPAQEPYKAATATHTAMDMVLAGQDKQQFFSLF